MKTYIFIRNECLFLIHRQTVILPILQREMHQTDTGVDGNQPTLGIEKNASGLREIRGD